MRWGYLATVSNALVGDVADVVRIETLRPTPLIGGGPSRKAMCVKDVADLDVREHSRQPGKAACEWSRLAHRIVHAPAFAAPSRLQTVSVPDL